jgi:hypothetical protein
VNLTIRLAALGAGTATFLIVASFVEPRPSTASDERLAPVLLVSAADQARIAQSLLTRAHPRGWPALGMMEGADYIVLMHGSPEGARYTVCARAGAVLAEDLPADQVYREFPSLDVGGMRLEPADMGEARPLMLADPVD